MSKISSIRIQFEFAAKNPGKTHGIGSVLRDACTKITTITMDFFELTMQNSGLEHIAIRVFENCEMKSLTKSREVCIKWKNFVDFLITHKKSLLIRLINEAKELVVAKAANQGNVTNTMRHLKDHLQLYKKWSSMFDELKNKLDLHELKIAWEMLKESCSAKNMHGDPFLYVFGGENEAFIHLLSKNFKREKSGSRHLERRICNYFDQQKLFFHACKYGVAATVRSLLNNAGVRGIVVDAIDAYWHPYLNGISYPTFVYETDGFGFNETAWHKASSNRNPGVLEELFENVNMPKTNINSTNIFGQTPLMYACKFGLERNVNLLLNRSAKNVGHRDRELKTALHFAADNGNKDIVEMLLGEPGIEANPSDENNETPLHIASGKCGWYDIVQLYCSKKELAQTDIDLNAKDRLGGTALHNAVAFDHPKITELLLSQNGIDKSPMDKFGETPLSIAQEDGKENIIALFNIKG